MAEKGGIPWGDLAVVGAIAAIAYFMKDTILDLAGKSGGTKDLPVCTAAMIEAGDPCRIANPFSLLPNVPVVSGDLTYVNPILCALTGKFCPDDGTADVEPKGADPADYNWTSSWTLVPETATRPTSERLLAKVNANQCFTNQEKAWAYEYDPTLNVLSDMMGCV